MTYAYGVMYTFYRYDMTVDEAVELGTDYLMRSQGDIPRDEQRPW
jgi:20S proteasome alpha/beta subunit